MKTPFRLNDHSHRPQPLAPPPAGYFEQLPCLVMARVQAKTAPEPAALSWLLVFPRPMRTMLASAAVLGGFVGAFYLNQPTIPLAGSTSTASTSLAAIPEAALLEYLAANYQLGTEELTALALPEDNLMGYFLQASPQELEAALELAPVEDVYL